MPVFWSRYFNAVLKTVWEVRGTCNLLRQKRYLIYAGKIDHGFDKDSTKALQAKLKPLIRKTQPYSKRIAHRGIWVEPSLLAEIEYRAKSAEGKVRHPVFKGLRDDL